MELFVEHTARTERLVVMNYRSIQETVLMIPYEAAMLIQCHSDLVYNVTC